MKKQSLAEAHAEYLAVVFSGLPDDSPERAQAVKKWDAALYNSGVYALAAQCLAAIDAEAATAKGDRKTALELARGMALSRTYASATLLALSKGKTFSQREAIRTAAAQAAQREADPEAAAQAAQRQAATKARVEAEAARAAQHEADAELDRKFKQTVIANGAPGAPGAKKPKQPKERKQPYSANAQQAFANLWNAAREQLGMPPLVRNFLENNKERLRAIGVESQTDVKRIKDAARHARLLKKWNKRKSSGKKRQA